ncbi:MAG: DEAD/DEAH box helicase, partial [Anaerolineae bacterium]
MRRAWGYYLPMTVSSLLDRWQTDADLRACLAEWRTLPPRPAQFAAWPPALSQQVVAALGAQGISRPYTHQTAAIEAALRGENVVMVTPTASGKTLGYNAPVLHTLLEAPDARALYLFPTKALAQDQLVNLQRLANLLAAPDEQGTKDQARQSKGIAASAPGLFPAPYDGDTPASLRKTIRDRSRLVLTNPDMLHAGILPHHPRWREFLAGLRYVVLDELHAYRGVFGSHVANVLRRLKRVCAFYGASPQFLCASATIANPEALAETLAEAPFTLIQENGAPQARKHFLFYNPPLLDPASGLRQGVVLAARGLARDLLAEDVQTLIFARSRLTVEVLLGYLQDLAGQLDYAPEVVQGYRSGYLPRERRLIEAGIRNGSVRTAVATNALELGIDIGGLEACLLAGYPGTIASTWQQAGRAGRRTDDTLAVLIAGGGALDQYLMANPHYFFDRSPEHARLAPDNLAILLSHLQCAAYELPFQSGETFGRAEDVSELLAYLAEEGLLRRAGGNWYWAGAGYPAEAVSLRSALADNILIEAETEVIGEIDRPSAPLFVYEGAIYIQQGQTYQVTGLDWEGGRARVKPVEVDYYTQAQVSTRVEILAVTREAQQRGTRKAHGQVLVTSQATGYRLVKRYSHETLGYGDIDLPEQEMDTTAYWLSLPEETLDRLRQAELWRFDRIRSYGPDWPQQRDAARARDGFRCRLCNAPEQPEHRHDVHHLRPLREFLLESSGPASTPTPNLAQASFPPEVYARANALANLITVCRSCHRRVETAQRVGNAWRGLAYALGNLAPLFLMCDPRDIGTTHETQPRAGQLPSITLYDQVPGGLGFSELLYELHEDLLAAARSLIEGCACQAGCPACVGPVLEGQERTKIETRELLKIVQTGPS